MKYPAILTRPLAILKKSHHKHMGAYCLDRIASRSDLLYRRRFKKILIPKLYRQHTENSQASCVFCRHLEKSLSHAGCFYCSKGIYSKCDRLLPGPFLNEDPETDTPSWLFRTTCIDFVRLDMAEYTKNLDYGSCDSVIIHYETLEGLFFGLCNGNNPCHICASISLKLFTQCPLAKNMKDSSRCDIILKRIKSWYG